MINGKVITENGCMQMFVDFHKGVCMRRMMTEEINSMKVEFRADKSSLSN